MLNDLAYMDAAQRPMINWESMSEEALRVLGLGADADARTVESTYWKRARELALQRATNPAAGDELESLNSAYQTLSKDFTYGTRRAGWQKTPRKRHIKRYVYAAVAGGAIIGGLVAGMGFRAEITDGAKQGYDQGEESWNDTIQWLQEWGTTPTPEKPGQAQQPNQGQ